MPIQKGKCNLTVSVEYAKAERNRKPLNHADEENINGKVIIITGATSGVGEAAALEFAKRGATVILPCRNLEKAQKVISEIQAQIPDAKFDTFQMDLLDLASIRKCAGEISAKYPKIDILINNAGFATLSKDLSYSPEGFESQMLGNHLGPHLFTHLLLHNIKAAAPSRIIFVTSMGFEMGELDPEDFMLKKRGAFLSQNFGPYCNAKLATNYCVKILAKQLAPTGVHVYALCPGFVNSSFQENSGWLSRAITNVLAISPAKGAENVLYCALMKSTQDQTGLMYRTNGIWEGAMQGLDEDIGQKIWEKSNECVGISE